MKLTSWMSQLDDKTMLSKINIPGTHDSATQRVKALIPHFFICQNSSILKQLTNGARFVDVRLEFIDNDFRLVHSVAKCLDESGKPLMMESVFNDFIRFVTDNPTETVMVSVKMDYGKNEDVFFSRFYKKFIENNTDKWYLENKIPLLSEVRGKLVLVRRCVKGAFQGNECGIDLSRWADQGDSSSDMPLECFMNNSLCHSALIQDRYGHNKKLKWKNCIVPFFESETPSDSRFSINFMSTAGYPKGNADYINHEFMNYPLEVKKYGVIIADFFDESISCKIINTNEGVSV